MNSSFYLLDQSVQASMLAATNIKSSSVQNPRDGCNINSSRFRVAMFGTIARSVMSGSRLFVQKFAEKTTSDCQNQRFEKSFQNADDKKSLVLTILGLVCEIFHKVACP